MPELVGVRLAHGSAPPACEAHGSLAGAFSCSPSHQARAAPAAASRPRAMSTPPFFLRFLGDPVTAAASPSSWVSTRSLPAWTSPSMAWILGSSSSLITSRRWSTRGPTAATPSCARGTATSMPWSIPRTARFRVSSALSRAAAARAASMAALAPAFSLASAVSGAVRSARCPARSRALSARWLPRSRVSSARWLAPDRAPTAAVPASAARRPADFSAFLFAFLAFLPATLLAFSARLRASLVSLLVERSAAASPRSVALRPCSAALEAALAAASRSWVAALSALARAFWACLRPLLSSLGAVASARVASTAAPRLRAPVAAMLPASPASDRALAAWADARSASVLKNTTAPPSVVCLPSCTVAGHNSTGGGSPRDRGRRSLVRDCPP
ncbi:hypothetical protein [Ornithinimicrobium kibberense]|uniref:hypothetical protein n=1 Tax=Ornithinimicrobium kibberense TaxID=282060 RepID=UPI00360F7A08